MTVRIGWLEIAFAVVLAIYATLAMLGVTGPSRAVLKLVLAVLGFWLAIRISRAVVKQMLWRLRNRLIVAYFFIAVVPIILITLLAGLGVALVGGQISIYLVTSELEGEQCRCAQAVTCSHGTLMARHGWRISRGSCKAAIRDCSW